MSKDQLDLFTDRVQAIALFEQLSQRAAGKDWPLLPILSLVGPAGYGKSQLMQQLYFNYCHTPFLPHASIDFNRSKTPHDLLNILGALRNNLQRQRDEKGHALTFPRFDIIYARLKRSENQEQKDEIDELLGDFSDAIGLIGNLNLIVGVLLLILKLLIRIPPVRALIRFLVEQGYQQMGNRPQWRWYQDQVKKFREINLPKDASIGEILARLNEMCTAGDPERDFLIEQILPKAFLADLRYGTNDTIAPVLKSGPPCVVIFLDSFESLLRSSEKTARTLLEALALNDYRKRGESDPLLLIVGSEERLPDMSREQLRQHFTLSANRRTAFREAQLSYQGWLQQFPTQGPRPGLRLRTIYLPLTLSALPLDYTRDYLLKLDQSNDTQIFTNEALIEDMQRVTAGYPVLLERIAQALPDTLQHNLDPLTQQEPLQALLTSEMGEQIIDRQLRTHCLQAEERTFMLSALPRMLTQELLGLVLKITDSNALSDEWKRYRNLPFLLADESKKTLSFAPGIRELFLLKLRLSQQTSDYIEAHQRLRDYFQRRVEASRRATGGYDS